MKILLIQPPIRDFYFTRGRLEPLGLEYLAASLIADGHSAQILNAAAVCKSIKIPLPEEMAYMAEHYHLNDISPFRLFSHFQQLGLHYHEIAQKVDECRPDLVGIACNFTPYEGESLACARHIKTKCPEIPIVLGGHHATVEYASLLQNPCVDFLIRGEGERSICLLAKALPKGPFSGIPGLAYRLTDGAISENPPSLPVTPLESLPRPSRTNGEEQMLITSRGCPRHCGFCSIAHVMGNDLRQRSVADVLCEVEEVVNLGAKLIDFEDDSMNWDKSRMLELMDGLARRFGHDTRSHGGACGQADDSTIGSPNYIASPAKLPLVSPTLTSSSETVEFQTADSAPKLQTSRSKISFAARNGLVAEKLDGLILQRMADAGFERVNLAVVSSNPEQQTKIDRKQPLDRFEEVVSLARKAGLKVTAYLILGLPTDTLDEMIQAILWLAHLPVEIGPSIFYPVPGTPLFDLCVRKKYILPANKIVFRSSAYPVETESFSRNDLVTLMRMCRMLNYLKNDEPLSAETLHQCMKTAHDAVTMATLKVMGSVLQIATEHRLSRDSIGAHLVYRFMENRRFHGLRFLKRKHSPFIYEEINYASSEKAATPIHAHLRQILKSQPYDCREGCSSR